MNSITRLSKQPYSLPHCSFSLSALPPPLTLPLPHITCCGFSRLALPLAQLISLLQSSLSTAVLLLSLPRFCFLIHLILPFSPPRICSSLRHGCFPFCCQFLLSLQRSSSLSTVRSILSGGGEVACFFQPHSQLLWWVHLAVTEKKKRKECPQAIVFLLCGSQVLVFFVFGDD